MIESIKLQNVYVKYDDNYALIDVNLSLKQNDFIGIIGPNGGGKTTLLKVMLGLIKPLAGEVLIFGNKPEVSLDKIGYVPQIHSIDRNFPITVEEVVLMGRTKKAGLCKPFSKIDKEYSNRALQDVDMLDFKKRLFGKLSGGELQRVLIARALSSRPEILLLDEPTASIDVKTQKGFYELLERLKEQKTIVLISHDVGVIAKHVDKIGCLNKKLFFHDSKEISIGKLSESYECPVEMLAHGVPHRVLNEHE